MKWQHAITKQELAHVRWSTHGRTTLGAFAALRVSQKKMEAESRARHPDFRMTCCHECNHIEFKLMEAGKLEVTK